MSTRWNDAILDHYRQMGDAEADAIVSKALGVKDGTVKLNQMLLLANQLIEQPGLTLVDGSRVATDLEKFRENDPGLADYYEPMEAPAWVDTAKLKLASAFWHENTVVSLGVLYAASLPSCYLIEKGIPALYKTGKLLPPYLTQRIYETGLMLDAVMDEDGISLIEDKEYNLGHVLREELNKCDTAAHWKNHGHKLMRYADDGMPTDGASQAYDEGFINSVNEAVALRVQDGTRRYLWGKGYITAKKVRLLHASMRFLLLNPAGSPHAAGDDDKPKPMTQKFSELQEPWDHKTLGAPVNQEDVAYTLLTFGLVIPKGLEKWGIPISQEQKDAFLHLWKLIGHIMGIEEDLLTDQWDEAEALYALVQRRQCGGSPDGVALTEALIGVLDDYLPKLPLVKLNSLPVELIIGQMGEQYGKELISEETLKNTRPGLLLRPAYTLLGKVAKLYLGLRTAYLKSFPLLGDVSANLVHDVGEGIIDSWRDAYRRAPFFVPSNLTDWQKMAGADPEYLKILTDWRQKVLWSAAFSLVLLVISVFGLTIAFPLWLLLGQTAFLVSFGVTVAAYALFAIIAKKRLTKLLDTRPKPDNRVVKIVK